MSKNAICFCLCEVTIVHLVGSPSKVVWLSEKAKYMSTWNCTRTVFATSLTTSANQAKRTEGPLMLMNAMFCVKRHMCNCSVPFLKCLFSKETKYMECHTDCCFYIVDTK